MFEMMIKCKKMEDSIVNRHIPKAFPYKKTLKCFSLEDNFEMKSRKFLSEYFRLGSIWRLQSLQMQESQSQSLPILTDGRLKEPHIQTIFNLCKFLQSTFCKSLATYVNFSQTRKCNDLLSNNVEFMNKIGKMCVAVAVDINVFFFYNRQDAE